MTRTDRSDRDSAVEPLNATPDCDDDEHGADRSHFPSVARRRERPVAHELAWGFYHSAVLPTPKLSARDCPLRAPALFSCRPALRSVRLGWLGRALVRRPATRLPADCVRPDRCPWTRRRQDAWAESNPTESLF